MASLDVPQRESEPRDANPLRAAGASPAHTSWNNLDIAIITTSSWASSPGIRSRMQLQRSRDTGPELGLRRELHRRGMRYRLDAQIVRGTRRRVDISFASPRVAIDVRGCFWHGCPFHGRRRHRVNSWYWPAKISSNKHRDADTVRRLRKDGWYVIVVWEHQDPIVVADAIEHAVRERARR